MPELRTFNQTVGPSIVIDSGILIEYLTGTVNGLKIKEMIFSNPFIVSINVSSLTIIEIYYIFRRKNSQESTRKIITNVKELVKIIPIEDFVELIGEVKSLTPFSLTDCSNIALAEKESIKVIFKHESEIDNQLHKANNSNYTANIIFIDDFNYFKE